MSFQQPVTVDARHGSDFAGGIVEGALLRTPCGPRRIETMRPGDMVVTRCEGLQPVRMILSRKVSREEFLKSPDKAPVRIHARGVGPMMPQKPLLLAGDHQIVVPGYRVDGQPDDTPVFVRAKDLLESDETAKIDKSFSSVTFFHLVFDSHVVFMVNGLPVESFHTERSKLDRIHPEVLRKLESAIPSLRETGHVTPAARYALRDQITLLPATF
ncbi:Hint domain-containing protein [Actibacterium pelagium]|uniref:Hedgehog/Intein (Hint) domain-containing protein n=1 Tax=Actibacterium pelagium TaxID=2029103 RepID=A0A917EFU3_9RHOB|nr:Hint domain-containing protein [Actibacterium pelagium]GGE37699.1 hypothetical protein GCM10011517_01840 [Actibacterium pelagium]